MFVQIHKTVLASVRSNAQVRSLHKLDFMSCLYTNADCLTNKMPELKLHVKNSKPKIIGITEVKPKHFRYNLQNCELAIENYEMLSSNNVGRGASLYIHESIQAVQVDFNSKFEEAVWTSIKLVDGDKLLEGCIYRSSSGTEDNDEELRKLLHEVSNKGYRHLLIMGGFNYEKICWNTWSTSSNESLIDFKFIECIRDCYPFQHVNKPTRGRINQDPQVLDLILTNEDGMVTDIEHYSPLGKSDHSILKFNFNCYFQQANTERVKFYYDIFLLI